MKGYALLALGAAILLLLLPLPALFASGGELPAAAPAGTESTPAAPTTATTTAPAATPDESKAVFRLLVGSTVIELEEREFLIRTLAFEMPAAYHTEALKAQAVAAYTYYSRQRQRQQEKADPALQGADFATPDPAFPEGYTQAALQERWGEKYTVYYNKLSTAVDAVLGKTITYQGALIDACYFALSPGATDAAATIWGNEVPYLQPVASPGDKLSPQYETVVTFSAKELKSKLCAAYSGLQLPEDPTGWLGTPTTAETGTVTGLPVGGQTLTGAQIRQALGLRSACFTVTCADGQFRFTVHGYGHNVGMSQYGADYLARQGYGYEEILKYYYTGVSVG